MGGYDNEDLVRRIQDGQTEMKEQLCLQNTGLIMKIIKPVSGFTDLEDLKQEGFCGLLEAAQRYDPDKGVSFAVYAWQWIRAAVYRYISSNHTVSVPEAMTAEVRRLHRLENDFSVMFGHDPDDNDLRAWLEVDRAGLENLKQADRAMHPASMDTPIDEDFSIADMIQDPNDDIESANERLDNEMLAAEVWNLVDALPEQQQRMIRERYQQDRTHAFREVADATGETVSRVRAVHDRAIRELRKPKNRKRLQPYLDDSLAYSWGLQGTGLQRFRDTWTSSVERAVLKAEET